MKIADESAVPEATVLWEIKSASWSIGSAEVRDPVLACIGIKRMGYRVKRLQAPTLACG